MDTIIHEQEGKIELLTRHNVQVYNDFQDLLKIEQEKLALQKEITLHTESISNTYQEEKKVLKKQVRRLKWQRAGLAVVVVVVIGLSL